MSLATEAQSFGLLDPKLCYLLDGILFIYGVIVTALYLRAKVGSPGLLWGKCGFLHWEDVWWGFGTGVSGLG